MRPAAGKERAKQWSSDLGGAVPFLVVALISAAGGVVLLFVGGKHPFGRRDDSGFIVLCCLAAGVYFGYRAWSSFQAERSLPGLTEENTAQAMSWAKETACPPVGRGMSPGSRASMEARQTCTWSGHCRIGAIVLKNDRSAEPWEVWIDGRTGLGRLRQRSRRTR